MFFWRLSRRRKRQPARPCCSATAAALSEAADTAIITGSGEAAGSDVEDSALNQLDPLPVEERGERLLAFPASDKLSSLAKRSALQEARGWIVRGAEVSDWRFSGYLRRDGGLLVAGPHVDGELLAAVLQRPPAVALAALARVAGALRLLQQEHGFDQPLQLNGVYLLADGGVLIFPPPVVRQLTETHSPAAMLAAAGRLNHPDLAAGERLSVTLAILCYRAVTGGYPFPAAREDDLRTQMRRLEVVPARLRAPGTDGGLSALMDRALRPGRNERRPALEEWTAALERVTREPEAPPPDAAAAAALQAEARELQQKYEVTFRRRVFLQRNLRTIVVVSVAALALGGILGSIIANQFRPRATRGFSPRQVVEVFYASMGALDHTTMEDAVIDDAGQGLINEAVNLFVISRVTQGYEGRSNIVDAAEWVAGGKPELPAGVGVYGASDLEIAAEQGAPQPVFRVTYLMWRPGGDDGSGPRGALQRGVPRSERVFLRQDRGDWVIFQFQEIDG